MFFAYAWKDFIRRRATTSLSVIGVTLSVALLVAVVSISLNVERAISTSMSASGADMIVHRIVKPCPFSEVKLPLDLGAIDAEVVDRIAALDEVEDASGVLMLWAFWQGHPTVVAGIDPTKKTIGPVRISADGETPDENCCAVTEGRYLVRYDRFHTMLTEEYAQEVGARVGDKIHLGPEYVFEVVGLVKLADAARISDGEAFITLEVAQDMYERWGTTTGMPGPMMAVQRAPGEESEIVPDRYEPDHPNVVDVIFVALNDTRHEHLVARVIEEWVGPQATITTSRNVDATTSALATVTRKSMLGVALMVLFFALLLIVRNALASVVERVREVGLLKAIGWRNADVSRLFVTQQIIAGIIGGVIGCIAGWLVAVAYGQVTDLQLPSSLNSFPPCSTTEPPLTLPLPITPSPLVFLVGMLAALLIGSIAGFAASRRASRLNPVDALRRF